MDIENRIKHWFQAVPKHLFKSITFDCLFENEAGAQHRSLIDWLLD